MDREMLLMDGWQFAMNEPKEESFKPVQLPHDWAIHTAIKKDVAEGLEQGFFDRWGLGWYRRNLRIEEIKAGYHYQLDFDGVYEEAQIWINGHEAGEHGYGYSPFRIDITAWLQEGENEILICVNNTKHPADRWYSGCGIYRTVKLLILPPVYIDEREVVIQTVHCGANREVHIDIGRQLVAQAILTKQGEVVAQVVSKSGKLVLLVAKPRLWTAETPELYNLTIQLLDQGAMDTVADEITMKLGIREFAFDKNRGMLVNGNPIKLKGVCIHQDSGCLGIAVTKDIYRQRLLHLKELGCNAIRCAHHAFSVEFLDLCDELGFYVYEEPFDKWTGGHYGRYFSKGWKDDMTAMMKRDRNRTCIFIWGVGNEVENQAQDSMLELLKMLTSYVKTLDCTRPVTYAMNPHFKRPSQINIADVEDIQKFVDEEDESEIYDALERAERIRLIGEHVDIISCNYQEQWYGLIRSMIPDKLILGTETYQFFKNHYDQLNNFSVKNPTLEPFRHDYVIGNFIWAGYDYLGESMSYPAKGWTGSLLRTNHEKRGGYYITQSYWSEKPMVRFLVQDYSLADEVTKEHWDIPMLAEHWHFPQFHKAVIPYMIPTNCDEVKLYLNERQIYIPKPDMFPNRLITGYIPWQPGTVKVIGYQNGQEVCRHEVKTPGAAVGLSFEQEVYRFAVNEQQPFPRQMLLTVKAYDEAGNPCFRESTKVRFRISGSAKVLAVDNGDLTNHEPYQNDFIHLYHGCASVLIQVNGSERVEICADGDGLRTGSAIITL